MATYYQVQNWVSEHYGFVPKTCWIAHVKELNRLPRRDAPNRLGSQRAQPCPPEKRGAIEAAFHHFGLLS